MDLTAFSLVQPWAGLLMAGVKRYENRPWAPKPGFYLVHASFGKTSGLRDWRSQDRFRRAITRAGMTDDSTWTQKAILGLVEVTAVFDEDTLPDETTVLDIFLSGVNEEHVWQFGRRWVFPTPVPCDGAQRQWRPPAELHAAINAQLAAAGAPLRIGPDTPADTEPSPPPPDVPESPRQPSVSAARLPVTQPTPYRNNNGVRYDSDIRALSVRQPWASLLIAGVKKYEVRPWTPPQLDLCLIHASSRKADGIRDLRAERWFQTALAKAGLEDEDAWPQSGIVGLAEFTRVFIPGEKLPADFTRSDYDLCGSTNGQYLWRTGRLWPFPRPVSCDGKLNLWRVPAELYAAVNEQLAAVGTPVRAGDAPP